MIVANSNACCLYNSLFPVFDPQNIANLLILFMNSHFKANEGKFFYLQKLFDYDFVVEKIITRILARIVLC
jgi:hypothetical protein